MKVVNVRPVRGALIARAAGGGVALVRAHRYLEFVLAGAVLVGLAVLVFGTHVRHGGFYSDDWSTASDVTFRGYRGTVDHVLHDVVPGRPILAAVHPVTHYLFGLQAERHLAVGVSLAVLASLCFFVLLRSLRVERPHALGMAALSLVFPWAVALHLWTIATVNNLALITYFLGTTAALTAVGLERDRRGRALALHLAASLLYVVSVLTYQVAPAVILGSIALYRTRVSWSRASRRWLLDCAVVLPVTAASAAASSAVREVGSVSAMVTDLPRFVRDDLTLFAAMFLPSGVEAALPNLLVLFAATGVVALSLVRARRGEPAVRTWLVRGGAGAGAVALSHVMFLGSGLLPSYSGIDDRANTLAAFGFVVVAYSVLVLVCLLVAPTPRWIPVFIAAALVLVGVGWIGRVRDDIALLRTAVARQADEMALLEDVVGRPPPGSTLLVFGFPATTSPGIPIFYNAWDLEGALRLRWKDYSLAARPIFRKGVTCDAGSIRPVEFQPEFSVPYERAIFVDLATRIVRPVRSREACVAARPRFAPGPLVAGE
ncbi:MAG: hypothetical protein H0V20_03775 [Actinobacteria bacterium]|nr:hypothetical protein [Actinomycetota bacterium]